MDEKNIDRYGNPPLPWSRALEQLESQPPAPPSRTYWLATTGPGGRPHVTGVGAMWVDGKLYFTSGAGTRKSRNLSENRSCSISVSLPGLDLVVEGEATQVTDAATLREMAERYAAQGWPATATDGALTAPYSAPSAGPPPWQLCPVEPRTAFGVATAELYGATRWRFD